MATLNVEVSFNFDSIQSLVKQFPELSGRFLALVGNRGRTLLKEQYLSGQELDLQAFPKDKAGRYTIVSNVNKRRNTTTISSYPLNLFEKGRLLRSGETEPGHFILTVKLRNLLMAGMPNYIKYFETVILSDVLEGVL